MNKLDMIEVQKHINIEITDTRRSEVKAICPFCRL